MKTTLTVVISILLILILTACSSATSTTTVAPTPTSDLAYPYPIPLVQVNSDASYPAPSTSIIQTPQPTYTADPSMGTVVGQLLLNTTPVSNTNIYLAEVIKDASGKDIIAGLDLVKSPNTTTDDDGKFTFVNIEEGTYALILDVVTNQFLLNYPTGNDSIVVDVEAGKEFDLGELNYDSLPIR